MSSGGQMGGALRRNGYRCVDLHSQARLAERGRGVVGTLKIRCSVRKPTPGRTTAALKVEFDETNPTQPLLGSSRNYLGSGRPLHRRMRANSSAGQVC